MNNMEKDFIKKLMQILLEKIIDHASLFNELEQDRITVYSYMAIRMLSENYRNLMIKDGFKEDVVKELDDITENRRK